MKAFYQFYLYRFIKRFNLVSRGATLNNLRSSHAQTIHLEETHMVQRRLTYKNVTINIIWFETNSGSMSWQTVFPRYALRTTRKNSPWCFLSSTQRTNPEHHVQFFVKFISPPESEHLLFEFIGDTNTQISDRLLGNWRTNTFLPTLCLITDFDKSSTEKW